LDVFTSGILSSNPTVAAIQAGIIGGPIDPYPIGVIDTPPVTAAGAKREPAGQLEPAALLIGNDPDFLPRRTGVLPVRAVGEGRQRVGPIRQELKLMAAWLDK
jgi:hypothetical protein